MRVISGKLYTPRSKCPATAHLDVAPLCTESLCQRCYLSATLSLSGSMSTATTEPPPTPACVFARMATANNLPRGRKYRGRTHIKLRKPPSHGSGACADLLKNAYSLRRTHNVRTCKVPVRFLITQEFLYKSCFSTITVVKITDLVSIAALSRCLTALGSNQRNTLQPQLRPTTYRCCCSSAAEIFQRQHKNSSKRREPLSTSSLPVYVGERGDYGGGGALTQSSPGRRLPRSPRPWDARRALATAPSPQRGGRPRLRARCPGKRCLRVGVWARER